MYPSGEEPQVGQEEEEGEEEELEVVPHVGHGQLVGHRGGLGAAAEARTTLGLGGNKPGEQKFLKWRKIPLLWPA